VKRRDLLFVDAHGGGPTLVEEMGEEMGVKTLTLGGTLDISGANAAGIRARLRQLLTTAAQHGTLVVSFKASILTLGVIESERASLAEQGIEIVPASKLVL